MTFKQIQFVVEACLREPAEFHGFPCERKSEPKVRQALKDYLEKNPYPGEDFYRLAYEFYAEVGSTADQCDILDRWVKAKGSPIEPINHYIELGEAGAVSDQKLTEMLEEGLKRAPNDLRLLTVAYDRACNQDNWARRIFYALQLVKQGQNPSDLVIYGLECGRNAMPERAEDAFNKALELDPKNVSALNGLAMCSFERMELGKSEELFRKSVKVEPNEYAQNMLKKIEAICKGEPWTKRAEARRKFWKSWADTELTRLSGEQRNKRMAEIVAGRR